MKYIAVREVFGGDILYFQDNENDSPKWTTNISEARRFDNVNDALTLSDKSNLYQIIARKVQE